MKKEKNLAEKITGISEKAPVTPPFSQELLVSKVNALTFNMNTMAAEKLNTTKATNTENFTARLKASDFL